MIDPSISLQVKTPDVMGGMMQGANMQSAFMKPALMQQQIAQSQQEVAASQTGQALTEQQTANAAAQNPGLVAGSEQARTQADTAKRTFDFQKWAGANSASWMKKDSNGNMVKDANGQPQIDMPVMMAAANSAHYTDMIPSLAKSWSDNTSNQISNATNQQSLDAATIKNGADAQGMTAMFADAIKDPEQQKSALAAGVKHIGDIFGTDSPTYKNIASNFANPSAPSNVEAKSFILGSKSQTLTAQQQRVNAQTDQQIQIAQLQADTSRQSMLQSGVSTQQALGETKRNADVENGNASFFNNGSTMGQQIIGTGIAKTAELWKANVLNNPAYAPYVGAVAKYNQENGTAYLGNEAGLPALLAEAGAKHHISGQGYLNSYQNAMNPPKLNGSPTQAPPAQIPPQNTTMPTGAPRAPTAPVNMVNDKGQSLKGVKPEHYQQAISEGYRVQ